jgi:hypothetical protein
LTDSRHSVWLGRRCYTLIMSDLYWYRPLGKRCGITILYHQKYVKISWAVTYTCNPY